MYVSMYVYMYVCIYVCIYVCMYVCMYQASAYKKQGHATTTCLVTKFRG